MFGKLFGKKSKDDGPEQEQPAPVPPKAPTAAAPVQSAPPPAPPPPAPPPPAPPLPAAPLPPVDPTPKPSARAPDAVSALAQDTQRAAADMADVAAQVERAIRAGAAAGKGAPITPDAAKALRAAAEALTAAAEPAAAQAVSAFKAGRLQEAFQLVRQDADSQTGASKVERLRRLGALAFLADAGVSMQAYLDAWTLDKRDFWNGVFLARLYGLGGGIDLAKTTAEQALAEARSPQEQSQAEAELALIALGRNDAAGARRHGEAAVALLRSQQTTMDLAIRLALLGDIAVFIADSDLAAKAYGESHGIVRQLGAQSPSDITLARAAADTQEKLAAVISRQNRHADAVAAGAQAVDLRRRLMAARPGEVIDVIALATVLNTFGEIHRLAGDAAAAAGAFKEAVDVGRKAVTLAGDNPSAHREIWVGLWRLADAGAAPWADVNAALEAAKAAGALLDRDSKFLDEARRRLGGGA